MKSFIACVDSVSTTQKEGSHHAKLKGGTWSDLYEQHARYVYYLALRTVRDPALAEDITHDVFLKAFRNLDRFRGQSSLRTWLYRVTINHCRNVQNSWHQRNVLSTDNAEVLDGPPTNTENPLRVLEIKELGQRIQTTLDALPAEYSLLLLLVADEHLSYQEVASLTEQTADAVRGKLYRARRAFIAEFQKTE
jgi:RNA polymerase sigma-70 factor (ECF subfamily)